MSRQALRIRGRYRGNVRMEIASQESSIVRITDEEDEDISVLRLEGSTPISIGPDAETTMLEIGGDGDVYFKNHLEIGSHLPAEFGSFPPPPQPMVWNDKTEHNHE